jgi:hypothetical protein
LKALIILIVFSFTVQAQFINFAFINPKKVNKTVKSLNKGVTDTSYIVMDSVKPVFNITVDGIELFDGDVVSSRPEIILTLKDESPLPIDTTAFTILKLDDTSIALAGPDIKFSYSPYPESEAIIMWNPALSDGKHTFEVFAKDPSGNYFDIHPLKYEFYSYNQPGIINVLNYPDPFRSDTYFTFQLLGQKVPDELKIKIFTIAGRLIKDFSIPASVLHVGFNKIYWNGKDQNNDEIANGTYFYKIIFIVNGIISTSINKMAKVK